jgi:hypothetical protein
MTPQVFLLSPAYCGGRRARILLKPGSEIALARRLGDGTLSLGEAFAFLSGLYFRGKLAYARAFARPTSAAGPSTLVITPTRGLQPPEMAVSAALLEEFAGVDVSADEERYRGPLTRDIAALGAGLAADTRVVLLGSIATGKYVDVLASTLGARLHYPSAFVGRGDMSRGGLLLRSVDQRAELDYAVFDASAVRHGPRPAKLDPLTRARRARDDPGAARCSS